MLFRTIEKKIKPKTGGCISVKTAKINSKDNIITQYGKSYAMPKKKVG